MRLESARALKRELLTGVVAPLSTHASRARGAIALSTIVADTSAARIMLGIGARALAHVPALQRSIALGVARHEREYRLAVRVQRQSLMSSSLLEHLKEKAKGEVDIRLIGRIDKRTSGGATAVWG